MFREHAVRDGLLVTGQQPFSGAVAAGLITEALRQMDLAACWATPISLFDARASDVLATVKVPVLILGAEHDALYPARQVERMRDAGHGTLIEARPETAAHIRRSWGRRRQEEDVEGETKLKHSCRRWNPPIWACW